jgi:hypothetical protein
MVSVAVRRRDNDGGVANPRFSEIVNGGKDRHAAAYIGQEPLRARCIQIGYGHKLTRVGISRQFVNVERVDHAHTAESGHCNFQRFHIS